LKKELLYYQENEEELMRTIVKIESNVQAFPKHINFPASDASNAAATLFYHRKTWYESFVIVQFRRVVAYCFRNTEHESARAYNRNWANQPAILRRWCGCDVVLLNADASLFDDQTRIPFFASAFVPRKSALPMNANAMAQFFYYSLSCTGRKDDISIMSHCPFII
jgi:hypothetical protein